MLNPNNPFSKVFVPNDVTAEARSLIEKYTSRRSRTYIWYEELAKDLVNYVERADLINEIFNQINGFYQYFMIDFYSTFAETLTTPQILTLTKTNYGSLVLNRLFANLYGKPPSYEQCNAAGRYQITNEIRNRMRQLAMKIENFRNPTSPDDPRPHIGDMVDNNESLDIYRYNTSNANDPWINEQGDYRFGGGHDGEHILGNRDGSRVKAIAGLTGTILTYHLQLPDRNYSVYILLNDNRTMLVLKDLNNLSPIVLKAPNSTSRNGIIPRFIDKSGKPISTVKIGVGETIGFTRKWSGK